MSKPVHAEDHKLAQEICKKLQAGDGNAIGPLYEQYYRLFLAVCRRRLIVADSAPKVLNNFWLEMLNARAICAYEGKASLRTYLLLILIRRCHDENRKAIAKRKREASQVEAADGPQDLVESPENEVLGRERSKIIAEAMEILEQTSPRDAVLVRMHLSGSDYRAMAMVELGNGDMSEDELGRRTAAVKKQFTRPKTGSMAKFRSAVLRCVRRHGLDWRDLL
ncbi:MAG: RNA polymerase sigma factor [Desulfatibacillaceae bacterium]